ncbi:MAG: DUF3598 family protein [Leptolyngbyaceae cyanobacterium]
MNDFAPINSSTLDADQSVSSQWDNFLQNLGEWQGSFTRMSPQGAIEKDSPSNLVLAKFEQDASVRLTLKLFDAATGEVDWERVLDFTSVSSNIVYFEDGAFSRGALHIAPFSQVGAEFCLMAGDRRLRLVQLYGTDSQLSQVTLIREKRAGSNAPERPLLTLENLLGTWEGKAVTRYADHKTVERYETRLVVERQGDRIKQHWQTPKAEITMTGQLVGSTLLFDEAARPVQILMLLDGASSTTPLQVLANKPFFSGMGWLLKPGLRQRIIRNHDAQGNWISATKITEHRR